MRAGELRRRGVIQKPNDAAAGWGGSRTWETYATVWANIEPVRGNESIDDSTKKSQANVTHFITIRFIRGLRPSMRFNFDGRIFMFEVVRNIDERDRMVIIEAREEADA
jgi:SPP1 family predicted phage head-tail adaptor